MTSQKKWPLVITLFFIIGLLLVACERPLPDDGSGDAPASGAPASTDSGAYPGPDSSDSGVDPAQPAPEPDNAGSGYPAPDAELIPPVEERDSSAEAYPVGEGESVEGETAEDAAAEQETAEGDTVEGEATSEEPTAEGETPAEGEGPVEQDGERTHTVAAGDNLYQIGLKYGVSWVAIAQANGIINPDTLTVGQVLIIPDISESENAETTEDAEAVTAAESSETEAEESTETEPAEGGTSETTYVVQSGDNLYRISLQFGVNMMDVARANGLSNFDDISVGQELIIPGVESSSESETLIEESPANEISHEVQVGETVFGIAFKYGIAWTKLVENNNLSSPYTLEAGQILLIPADE